MDVPGLTPTEHRTGDIVADDRPCMGCSYNLRGLRRDGACPECGALVARSMFPSLLAAGERKHIARLRLGAALLVVAILCAGVRDALTWTMGALWRLRSNEQPIVSVWGREDPPLVEARFRGPEVVRIRLEHDGLGMTATRSFFDGSSVTSHVEDDGSVWWEASTHDPEGRGEGARRVETLPARPKPSAIVLARSALLRWLGGGSEELVSASGLVSSERSLVVETGRKRAVTVIVLPTSGPVHRVVRFHGDGRAEMWPSPSVPPPFKAFTRMGWINRVSQSLLGVGLAALLAGSWLITRRDRIAAGSMWAWLRWGARVSISLKVAFWITAMLSMRAFIARVQAGPFAAPGLPWTVMYVDPFRPIVEACVLVLVSLFVRRVFHAVGDAKAARACAWFALIAPLPGLAAAAPALARRLSGIPTMGGLPGAAGLYRWLTVIVALTALWLLLRLRRRLRRHANAMRTAAPAQPSISAPA